MQKKKIKVKRNQIIKNRSALSGFFIMYLAEE